MCTRVSHSRAVEWWTGTLLYLLSPRLRLSLLPQTQYHQHQQQQQRYQHHHQQSSSQDHSALHYHAHRPIHPHHQQIDSHRTPRRPQCHTSSLLLPATAPQHITAARPPLRQDSSSSRPAHDQTPPAASRRAHPAHQHSTSRLPGPPPQHSAPRTTSPRASRCTRAARSQNPPTICALQLTGGIQRACCCMRWRAGTGGA